jgi:hypothetical protein
VWPLASGLQLRCPFKHGHVSKQLPQRERREPEFARAPMWLVGAKIGQREPPHARLGESLGDVGAGVAMAPQQTFRSLPEKTPVDYARRPCSTIIQHKKYSSQMSAPNRRFPGVRRRSRSTGALAPNRHRVVLLIASKQMTLQAVRVGRFSHDQASTPGQCRCRLPGRSTHRCSHPNSICR